MKNLFYSSVLILLLNLLSITAVAQDKPNLKTKTNSPNGVERSLLVTVYPRGEKERAQADKLMASDFAVYENERRQTLVSVKNAAEVPLDLAIVIQDNLNWRVNTEIKGLKEFIRNLPDGSRVLTAYLTTGGAIVTQELTADRARAAETLRVIRSASLPPSFTPFDGVRDVVTHFEENSPTRKIILLISDGLDLSRGFGSASPYFSLTLDRAVRDAQQRGVAVFTIYAPSEDRRAYGRFATNYGQGSLIRLADETGGESYFSGADFISFAPYLEEFKETFARQWLIRYRSSTADTKFRRVKVTTDFDIHLHYAAGFEPRKNK